MPSDTTFLAFDTSAAHCAAALLSGGRITVTRLETMQRGQTEHLMPLLHGVLEEGGKVWSDLAAIGVGVGPGNFTGIRIAVSAARGLALGLNIPAVGVNGCQARGWLSPNSVVAIPAPREQVYLCDSTDSCSMPRLMPKTEAEDIAGRPLHPEGSPKRLAEAIAWITAANWQTVITPPAPLYARAADAAPSSDVPPVLLD